MSNKPRIVVYGIGQYGKLVCRIALEKGWTIVAALNRAGEKVGQDLGRLCKLDEDLGLIVQDCDTFDYGSVQADMAFVTTTDRLKTNLPAYQRLMGAGMNVICHAAESSFPFGADPETAAEIDALAKQNGVSFTGTGLWDMSRIWSGILVTGPCTRLESLFLESTTNIGAAGKHVLPICGVGLSPAEFNEQMVAVRGPLGGLYKLIPEHVMAALGFTVTRVTETREPVIFDEPVHCRVLNTDIPAGVCVGMRIVVDVETAEGQSARAHIELRLLRPGETEHVIWKVRGKPHCQIRVERRDSVYTSASTMINRVPDVMAAAPGIRLLSEYGPLRHSILSDND